MENCEKRLFVKLENLNFINGKAERKQRQAADETIMIIKLSSLMRILNIKFKARSNAKKKKKHCCSAPTWKNIYENQQLL